MRRDTLEPTHTCSMKPPQAPKKDMGFWYILCSMLMICAFCKAAAASTLQTAKTAAKAPPLAPAMGTLLRSYLSARYFMAPSCQKKKMPAPAQLILSFCLVGGVACVLCQAGEVPGTGL